MRIYIATSDKTNWILELSVPMIQRVWKGDGIVLGFSECETYGYKFKSLGKNQDIEKWSWYLFNYLRRIKDEYIFFMLDDFFIKGLNYHIFDWVMQNEKFSRYELGVPSRFSYMQTIRRKSGFDLWEYAQNSTYRISCQPSIWKREYLLYFLKLPHNPWKFEIMQNKLSVNDSARIIATNPRCLDYITSSALSRNWQNQININGMEGNDLMRIKRLAHKRGMGTINI